jgi:plasmid stabilization system protein ParE
MQINYTGAAFEALIDVVNFVESKNTIGAGIRWLNRFEDFLIRSLSNPKIVYPCHNKTFNDLGLRCLNYNDWVIGFSIHDEAVLIEALLHTSRLTD